MKHTKGKWKIKGKFITALHEGVLDIEICQLTQYRNNKENEANAKLMAAAPDLLEALKLLIAHDKIQDIRENLPNCHELEMAEQAIKKATE